MCGPTFEPPSAKLQWPRLQMHVAWTHVLQDLLLLVLSLKNNLSESPLFFPIQ